MYVNKNFSFQNIMIFSGGHIVWISIWALIVTCLHEYSAWGKFSIPWLPLSLIGTAVAFYIGFKNNQAYDRLWEARKIWGAIINSSRSWGSAVKAYLSNHFQEEKIDAEALGQIHFSFALWYGL